MGVKIPQMDVRMEKILFSIFSMVQIVNSSFNKYILTDDVYFFKVIAF